MRMQELAELLEVLDFVVDSLTNATNSHPGDNYATMMQLLQERKEAPGWENWAKLLQQRLALSNIYDEGSRSEGNSQLKNVSNQ